MVNCWHFNIGRRWLLELDTPVHHHEEAAICQRNSRRTTTIPLQRRYPWPFAPHTAASTDYVTRCKGQGRKRVQKEQLPIALCANENPILFWSSAVIPARRAARCKQDDHGLCVGQGLVELQEHEPEHSSSACISTSHLSCLNRSPSLAHLVAQEVALQ